MVGMVWTIGHGTGQRYQGANNETIASDIET